MVEDQTTPEDAADDGAARALHKAVDLLAIRPHFVSEIEQKLRKRRFESSDIASALVRLEELGYLDDRQAAESFARQRVERKGWGPQRLRAELSKRRVDDSIVADVLAQSYPDGERPVAQRVAQAWLDRGGLGRDRLGRFLARRGFSKGAIVEILSRLEMGSQTANPDDEFGDRPSEENGYEEF